MDTGTFNVLMERRTARHGAKIALIASESGEAWTYAQLEVESGRIAHRLLEMGLGPGSRVAFALPNWPVVMPLILGSMKLGAVPIPLDQSLKSVELRELLTLCEADLFVSEAGYLGCLRPWTSPCRQLVLERGGLTEWPARRGFAHSGKLDGVSPINPSASATAIIIHTSGSTGGPKAVAVSHAALLSRLRRISRRLELGESFVFLSLLPYKFDVFYPCLTSYFIGGTLVLCPAFGLGSLPGLWSTAARFGAHTIHMVPSVISALIDFRRHYGRIESAAIRFITSTSALLTVETLLRFEDAYRIPLLNCYGLKETGAIAFTHPDLSRRIPGAVGEVSLEEVRILGPDGSSLASGETGQIAFKVFDGDPGFHYCRRPDLNARSFRGGWFLTRDTGSLDDRGRLYLHGRTQDSIIHGGRQVSAGEVERVLRNHPAVRDVVVLGIPDPVTGERVVSCVVLDRNRSISELDLMRHCRESLADYKCPCEVKRVDAIPRTPLGKLRRHLLRGLFHRVAPP